MTGTVEAACIALGCMADRPIAPAAEEASIGAQLTEARRPERRRGGNGRRRSAEPIVASAWYRREILPVHFRRLLLSQKVRDSLGPPGEGG